MTEETRREGAGFTVATQESRLECDHSLSTTKPVVARTWFVRLERRRFENGHFEMLRERIGGQRTGECAADHATAHHDHVVGAVLERRRRSTTLMRGASSRGQPTTPSSAKSQSVVNQPRQRHSFHLSPPQCTQARREFFLVPFVPGTTKHGFHFPNGWIRYVPAS